MIEVSDCLPSDALSQRLPSYVGFSYLGHGVSLHGCSNKTQPLLHTLNVSISSRLPFLTLDMRYLLSAACHSCKQQCQLFIDIYVYIYIYVYNRHILIDTNILYLFFIFYIIFYIFVSILCFESFNRYIYFVLTQWCLTLSDHMDYSPPGSTVHRISQARILEWVAISFSRGSSRPKIEPTSLVSPA